CASVTTPTSRRRDVRASTATAPAADEERGAQFSPALAKKRENGCRLLLLRYTSGRQPPSNYLGRAVFFSRVSPPRGEFSPATPRGNHSHNPLPRTPYPPPSTLPRALPASSDPHGHDREPRPTESCRFSASQPSDSPPRHAFSDADIVPSSSLSATILLGTSARALLKSSQSLSPVVSDLKRTAVQPLNRYTVGGGEGGRSALYINLRDKWHEVVLWWQRHKC
ncbi:hypothetical protein ALC53_08952, partial [Atta colombica]